MMTEIQKKLNHTLILGLFGNLNGDEYSSNEGKKFAYAYLREDLKAMDCNPDILAQQDKNQDNHIRQNTWTLTIKH
jgi:hypothetical protein